MLVYFSLNKARVACSNVIVNFGEEEGQKVLKESPQKTPLEF